MKNLIDHHETVISRGQIETDGKMIIDPGLERAQMLVNGFLQPLVSGEWCGLYQNPCDGKLWEVDYPYGHMHGGGPISLIMVSTAYAKEKYGWTHPTGIHE